MAREVIVKIRDDLNPKQDADKTVTFGFHGQWYEIDLTELHEKELAALLAVYIEKGRPLGKGNLVSLNAHGNYKTIRRWAQAQNPPLPTQGKKVNRGYSVPQETIAAYYTAFPERRPT